MFLVSITDPTQRYELLYYDSERKVATFQGLEGPFTIRRFSAEKMQRDGYELKKESDLPALAPCEPEPDPPAAWCRRSPIHTYH